MFAKSFEVWLNDAPNETDVAHRFLSIEKETDRHQNCSFVFCDLKNPLSPKVNTKSEIRGSALGMLMNALHTHIGRLQKRKVDQLVRQSQLKEIIHPNEV